MAAGQARARQHQPGVPVRDRHGEAGGDGGPGARLDAVLLHGHEVEAGVAGVGPGRDHRLRVEAAERQLRVRHPYPTSAAIRSAASLRRSSGTVRLMRTKPSPLGP